MRSGRTTLFVIALLIVAALPALATGTVLRHETAQTVIRACVLGIGGQTADNHPNPYLIEGLRKSSLAPAHWVFENPLAPPALAPPADVTIRGHRDYWFVPLNEATADRLSGMDLIYVADNDPSVRGFMSVEEQTGLLAAVEAGALLWIDGDRSSDDLLTDLGPFRVRYDRLGDMGYMRVAPNPDSSILRAPHLLDRLAVAFLGNTPNWQGYQAGGTWSVPGDYVEDLDNRFRTIVEVLDASDREAFVLAADHGSGSIVVTTGGVGRDVTAWIMQRQAAGGTWRPTPDPAQAPDVKLALNMIQWNHRWQQARRSPRASASSVARAPMPLRIAWQYPAPGDDSLGAVVSTPVVGDGMVYAVSQPHGGDSGSLFWLDLDPRHELMDDMRHATGAVYDLVQSVELSGDGGSATMTPRYSSPTLTSYRDPDGTFYPHVVLVSYVADAASGTGWVDCYDASRQEGELEPLWQRQIPAYSANGQVVALSTPVVHNGFVYLLSSEFDSNLPGTGVENTYGRVHCFDLNSPASWVYPSHVADIDGDGSAPAQAENQRLLPAFHDPEWVADADRDDLPPAPGAIPVVHSALTGIDGVRVDAAVTFGTPVSHTWDGSNIVIDDTVGGSQFTVIPAPSWREGADTFYALNAEYFLVRTNREMEPETATPPGYAPGGTRLVIDDSVTQPPGVQYDLDHVLYSPGKVREAIVEAVLRGADPLATQTGVDVLVSYESTQGPVNGETHRLQGPVRWKRTLAPGQEIVQPATMSPGEIVVTASTPVEDAGASGTVARLDAGSGEVRWSYDPVRGAPGGTGVSAGITAAVTDGDALLLSSTEALGGTQYGSVMALHRQVDASVALMHQPSEGEEPVAVRLTGSGQIISASSYSVDPWDARLTFPASTAGDVTSESGDSLGPIYGRAITIEWQGGSLEDRLVPQIERFHHTRNHIRLRHYPVQWDSVVIRRPDGTVIPRHDDPDEDNPGWRFAADAADAADFGHPDEVRSCSLDGWIDMTFSGVEPGDTVVVSYRGWIERDYSGDGLPEGFTDIPDATWNLPREVHQVPVRFGVPNSPAVAGNTIHMGTEGLPGGAPETLLSMIWDRATGLVRSSLAAPADVQGAAVIPVVASSPSVAEDQVLVGSWLKSEPGSTDSGPGYVSALRPWRLLIADTNRIVETTGSEPSWICTATLSPARVQSFMGEDVRQPFNRPARASYLTSGNVLVVDTGNHRVVEIDRAGRIVWPLDSAGYDYYSSPENRNLRLSRPADAHRYYSEDAQGMPVMHTVIADTGNARVISITTRLVHDDGGTIIYGRQHHTVETVTPAYIRMGAARGYERVRYTSAQPIRDPSNHAVVGYLCAAGNLDQLLVVEVGTRRVNPPADQAVGEGTTGSTWAQWAWLYDHAEDVETPVPDGERRYVANEPLRFESIKHAEYRRHGDSIYLTVTAGRYLGREGFLYCDFPDCLKRWPTSEHNPGDPCPDGVDGTLRHHHHMAAAGPGVFEFRIDVSDTGSPDSWRLVETASDDQPHWYFVRRYVTPDEDTRRDYSGEMTRFTIGGETISKQWFPVAARRLPNGEHLIVNGISQIESATPANVRDSGAVYGPHIFVVSTDDQGDDDPHTDEHTLDTGRSVPAPGQIWADPFTQPAYAEIK